MRIKSVTVKALRSKESYSHDSLELRAELDDGDDWEAIEAELRDKAAASIEAHWQRRAEAERAKEIAERDERARRVLSEPKRLGSPCGSCGWRYDSSIGCKGCPAEEQASDEHKDIPF